jgi:hypothetical protein
MNTIQSFFSGPNIQTKDNMGYSIHLQRRPGQGGGVAFKPVVRAGRVIFLYWVTNPQLKHRTDITET